VIGQIVTGIGFLGAGVMLMRDGLGVGVISASATRVLAAVGVIIATDHLAPAIKLSVVVVIILYGVEFLEEHTKALSRGVHARLKRYAQRNGGAPQD
tara:strand:- start:5019 stop:5309 length:291 start_codon:yes stop_codon:yes gene_type:complete